jgi:hypothetical protein
VTALKHFVERAGGLLPATVLVALVLFVARELLEWRRRSRANLRKTEAIKKLLARECELNLWTHRSLKDALEHAEETLNSKPPGTITIRRMPSGHDRWEYAAGDGESRGGGSLPPVRRTIMEDATLPVAELDRRLFAALEAALDATAELDHLRGSFVNYADDAEPLGDEFFVGFVEWALGEFDEIYDGLNTLYLACTNRKLEKFRLR